MGHCGKVLAVKINSCLMQAQQLLREINSIDRPADMPNGSEAVWFYGLEERREDGIGARWGNEHSRTSISLKNG